ncbi:hypothetical protein Pfo_031142 [Paulownia fortunei]|nr:hypothetical protein Pfo_031142 [Paulownia fortunei]
MDDGTEHQHIFLVVEEIVSTIKFLFLALHLILLVNLELVEEGCTNERWKWFKVTLFCCLGALDGMYIKVRVPQTDKARYRNRKKDITVNVLGVCDQNMKFMYVLIGWEGSTVDSRILRDAISRRNGLRVPSGSYYLCDSGYTNGVGFLAPYKGVRYHLNEWDEGDKLVMAMYTE